MKKDQDTYRIQKELTENASHELQTPLPIIRSKLDLLMLEDLSESQMRFVSDLDELTVRMGHFNRNLLLLAKIDNAQYAALKHIDIANLLSESLPLYESLLSGKSLRFIDSRTDRTAFILLLKWGIVLFSGRLKEIKDIGNHTWCFLLLSGLATGLSWLFYFKALQAGDVAHVAPIDKFSVVITILLACLFLKEAINAKVATGALLITAGSIVMLWK